MNKACVPYRRAAGRTLFDDFFWPSAASRLASHEDSGRTWRPAVDIKESEHSFIVTADIPGIDPKEIDITVESGQLLIKGERVSEQRKEEEGYTRVERSFGNFSRSFLLPDIVDVDGIKANGKDGVLTVVLPKKENSRPKTITVQ